MPSNDFDLDDIEDIITENSENVQRKSVKDTVLPHPRITTFEEKTSLKDDENEDVISRYFDELYF